jgi:hypothetical protein
MIRWRMPQWRVSALSVFLLAGLIVLILLIVLIPDDVDLPDAAFHRGTAPLALRALATAEPMAIIIAIVSALLSLTESLFRSYLDWDLELSSSSTSRPILLRKIRC